MFCKLENMLTFALAIGMCYVREWRLLLKKEDGNKKMVW